MFWAPQSIIVLLILHFYHIFVLFTKQFLIENFIIIIICIFLVVEVDCQYLGFGKIVHLDQALHFFIINELEY